VLTRETSRILPQNRVSCQHKSSAFPNFPKKCRHSENCIVNYLKPKNPFGRVLISQATRYSSRFERLRTRKYIPLTTAKDLPMRFLLTNPLLFYEGVRFLAKSFAP
jgi:hypothetical protein